MKALHRALQLALERLRHAVAEFTQVSADSRKFFLPKLGIDGQ
jgi:hypothetical protein